MLVKFICGCRHEVDSIEFHSDESGMIVCPTHLQRRYGWRSTGRNHQIDGWTPVEVERYALFGTVAPVSVTNFTKPVSPDMRDNRDPLAVYASTRVARASEIKNQNGGSHG